MDYRHIINLELACPYHGYLWTLLSDTNSD